jgi:hypothetical protein
MCYGDTAIRDFGSNLGVWQTDCQLKSGQNRVLMAVACHPVQPLAMQSKVVSQAPYSRFLTTNREGAEASLSATLLTFIRWPARIQCEHRSIPKSKPKDACFTFAALTKITRP